MEPIQIRTGVKDIKAGLEHTVVLDTNRRVYAWGSNEYNHINSSNNKIIMTPYMITDYSELIGAGDYQTYYHGTDFELCGIGKNEKGMISNNLHSLFYIQKISCGDKHAAAIDLNGQLWVWGDNSKGQLGTILSNGESYTVEPINTGIYADNIYAGENITAYIEGGQVYQSGNVYEEDNSEFKRIGNSVGIVDLSLGNTFSVGIDANDNLWRWGKMTDNDGFSDIQSNNPLKIEYDYAFSQVDSYRNQSLAIDELGQVLAWGEGYYADGSDSMKICTYPIKIEGIDNPIQVSRGKNHNLVLDKNGDVYGWGSNSNNPMGDLSGKVKTVSKLNGISNVQQIAAGTEFSIFVKKDGTIWGVGKNDRGQLGQGTTSNSSVPIRITEKSDFRKISVGEDYVAALAGDGIYTWGGNSNGQLGNGTTVSNKFPVKLSVDLAANEHFTDISAGIDFCLALTNLGNVYAWGDNANGELGQHGTYKTPTKINALSNISKISAGKKSALAIKNDGTVYGWGYGYDGQLGMYANSEFTPKVISSLSGKNINSITCGYNFSIALDVDGNIYSFGNNEFGQLGVYTMTSKMSFKEKETVTETIEGTDTGGKTSYDVTAQSGGEYILKYIAKTDGTYTFNTVSNNGTSLVVAAYKDSNFTKPYKQTSNNGLLQVGAEKNSTIYLRYINPDNISFSATTTVEKISDTVEDNQTVYAILYDSPYFEEGYAADGKFLGSRYLGSNLDERYEYNTNGTEGSNEFFKNYLSLVKDKNVVFVICMRDIDYDSDENGNLLTLSQINEKWSEKADEVSDLSNNIITNMYNAYVTLEDWEKPKQIPKFYIGTPLFNGGDIDLQPEYARTQFIQNYISLCESVYNKVQNHINDLESDKNNKFLNSSFAGMYYGKEDPFKYEGPKMDNMDNNLDGTNIYTLMMKSFSEYVHWKDKKVIWFPYTAGKNSELENLGDTVNRGKGFDGNDICDIAIIQPNYFYYEMNTSAGDTGYMQTMNDIYQSTVDNCVKYWDDETQKYVTAGGEKTTDTMVSFQIEYDMSLVSGRATNVEQNPIDKADKLAYTISVFHDLIYGNHRDTDNIVEQKSFGIYAGGPNEQGYTWEVLNPDGGMNVNTHSNRNFVNLLGDMGMVHFYEMRYYLSISDYYWNKISNEYNGKLIYDITHMLFYCDEDGSYIPDPLITFFGQDRIKQMFKLD